MYYTIREIIFSTLSVKVGDTIGEYGRKIKSLRIEKKLTQKQVADRVGVAISAISSYESGTRYPSYEVLIKLARTFHVSTDYLLGINTTRTVDISGLTDSEIELISQLIDTLRINRNRNKNEIIP